jgi:uncharacterized protein (TIGR03437 family)
LAVAQTLAPPEVFSVVNAASLDQRLSPGVLAVIHGWNLTGGDACVGGTPLPTELCGAQVTVDGQFSGIQWATAGQLTIHFPTTLGTGLKELKVMVSGLGEALAWVAVELYAPGLMSTLPGVSPGVFMGPAGLITESCPALPGEMVQGYAVGLGAVTPPVGTGQEPPANPPATTNAAPEVFVAGATATVVSSALTPGLVGVYGVAFVVPKLSSPGLNQVKLRIGGVDSNTVLLPIQSASQAVGKIIAWLETSGLDQNGTRHLIAILAEAQAALQSGADGARTVGNRLRAFTNAVEAQRGKKLTEAQANDLIQAANRILAAL